jgi:hypothetical protein
MTFGPCASSWTAIRTRWQLLRSIAEPALANSASECKLRRGVLGRFSLIRVDRVEFSPGHDAQGLDGLAKLLLGRCVGQSFEREPARDSSLITPMAFASAGPWDSAHGPTSQLRSKMGFSDSLRPAGDSSPRAPSGSMMLVSDIAGVAAG